MTLPEFNESLLLMIKGLTRPEAYRHEVKSVELVETHISWILLTGDFAYKIKKPVNFGFLDFSTLEKRAFFCSEEIRLNQRLSPSVYLDAVAITGSFEKPEMEGAGQPIEYAVKMVQFDSGDVLNQRAANGCISRREIDQIADQMAQFHQTAAIADSASPYGEIKEIAYRSDENFEQVKRLLGSQHELLDLNTVAAWANNELAVKQQVFEARKLQGFVRECHGDWHLGNMTLHEGQLIVFDCLEFNPLLRWIDVISELAFVVMDLAHSGLMKQGFSLVNRYLQLTGDYQGITLFRYYLVYRAMVLAKVALFKQQQAAAQSEQEKNTTSTAYHSYLKLAGEFSQKKRPVLMITCGFSGSGKSTISNTLAEQSGALWLRSDVERKRLYDLSSRQSGLAKPGEGIYSAQARVQVYQQLVQIAEVALAEGFSVIVDATFLKAQQRALFYRLAQSLDAVFLILHCDAPEPVMRLRIEQRNSRQNDPSEATVEVMHQQLQTFEPLTEEEQTHTLQVNSENQQALEALITHVKRHSGEDSALL